MHANGRDNAAVGHQRPERGLTNGTEEPDTMGNEAPNAHEAYDGVRQATEGTLTHLTESGSRPNGRLDISSNGRGRSRGRFQGFTAANHREYRFPGQEQDWHGMCGKPKGLSEPYQKYKSTWIGSRVLSRTQDTTREVRSISSRCQLPSESSTCSEDVQVVLGGGVYLQ